MELDLQAVAMCVTFGVSRFTNKRKNQEVTDKVILENILGKKSGQWDQFLINPDHLVTLTKSESVLRKVNYKLTLPFEKGKRLLLQMAQPAYEKEIGALIATDKLLVEEFLSHIGEYMTEAKAAHNGTFNAALYPRNINAWRARFVVHNSYSAVPISTQYSTFITAAARSELEQYAKAKVAAAMRELWFRLIEPVSKMSKSLASPEVTFKDTLVDNVKEIVELAPMLNLVSDPLITKAATDIKLSLCHLDPEVLRNDPVMRKDAAEKASALLARYGTLGARKLAA